MQENLFCTEGFDEFNDSEFHLTETEIKLFKKFGWIGTFPLLSHLGVSSLTEQFIDNKHLFLSPSELNQSDKYATSLTKPWFKSLHAYLPSIYDAVTHPSIINKVKQILGENILLWGTSVTTRKPNQSHRWHIDVEHKKWKGVSVFIGLKGASTHSTLKVLPMSHTFNEYPEKNIDNDDIIITQSRKFVDNPEIIQIQINPGEFFIFDGLIWHGSDNISTDVRYSIIAQYTIPSSQIMIPINFDEPINWIATKPPCVLVSGTDAYKINNLVTRP